MQPYTVLAVDDEAIVKRTLKKLLESHRQFRWAGEAEDGQEALGLVRQLRPDVVITDISMPVMDGMELLQRLGDEPVRPEVVILSGYDHFAYVQEAIRQGVLDYLLKPIKPDQFDDVLRRVSGRLSEKRRQLPPPSWHWLPMCEALAKRLAESVWLTDARGVEESLENLRAYMDDPANASVQPHMVGADVLHLVSAELKSRGGADVPVPIRRANALRAGDDPAAVVQAVRAGLAETIDEIRGQRNWVNHNQIREALQSVERRFTDPSLSMQQVAAELRMSPAYFSRTFKTETGATFVQYVNDLRMERVKQLMSDVRLTTAEASRQAGFADYPHFTKAFKKQFGVTPSEYRKRLGISL